MTTPDERFGIKPKKEPTVVPVLYCLGVLYLYYFGFTNGGFFS
jgi:hypothetical protein